MLILPFVFKIFSRFSCIFHWILLSVVIVFCFDEGPWKSKRVKESKGALIFYMSSCCYSTYIQGIMGVHDLHNSCGKTNETIGMIYRKILHNRLTKFCGNIGEITRKNSCKQSSNSQIKDQLFQSLSDLISTQNQLINAWLYCQQTNRKFQRRVVVHW